MSAAVDEIMEKLKTLTLLEASELVKQIEEVFDVSAAGGGGMPMIRPGMLPGGPAAPAEEVEEKTEFDVVLEEVPSDKKIAILKVVRKMTGLGLKEAKDVVESAPKPIKEGIPKEDAEGFKKELEDAGAKASVK